MIADSASMAGFKTHLAETIAAGGWYVPTHHGIENGWLIVPKNNFENHLNELEKQKDVLWVAPFADVLKYHKERNCAKLVAISENKHRWILQLTDTLNNDTTWNQPLTINLKDGGREIKNIQQGGNDLPFIFSEDNIIFNVLPGGGKIVIIRSQ